MDHQVARIERGGVANGSARLSAPSWIAIALVVIGALNWGLVGLFKLDVVAALFGSLSPLSRIIYVLVALAGLYLLFAATRFRREPGTAI